MAPGINLLCMTILVGWRLAGLAGALISLAGLLLPSVSITIVMIALYADVRQLPRYPVGLARHRARDGRPGAAAVDHECATAARRQPARGPRELCGQHGAAGGQLRRRARLAAARDRGALRCRRRSAGWRCGGAPPRRPAADDRAPPVLLAAAQGLALLDRRQRESAQPARRSHPAWLGHRPAVRRVARDRADQPRPQRPVGDLPGLPDLRPGAARCWRRSRSACRRC